LVDRKLERGRGRPAFGVAIATQEKIISKWGLLKESTGDSSIATAKTARSFKLPPAKIEEIIQTSKFKDHLVEIKEEIKAEVYQDKVPIIEQIVSLSLCQIRDFLLDLSTNEEKKKCLSVRDVRDLSVMSTNLNETLRLELGKSTKNVEITEYSYHKVQVLLDDLRTIDPVFDYPQIEGSDESPDA